MSSQKEKILEKCVHELFAEQAINNPHAIAIKIGSEHITYDELNERAARIAYALRIHKVGPNIPVGIIIERSVDLIVGLLAILKAGGVCVPLDLNYPEHRLKFMVENSGLKILLTTKNLLNKRPVFQEISKSHTLLCLDTINDSLNYKPTDMPRQESQLDNLIYILYTSGSTGQPKGVCMPHRSLGNLLQWHLQNESLLFTLNRTLQFSPISFDVSFQEIFSTLCVGGTLILLSEEIRRNPQALYQFILEEKISRLFLPVIALHQLAEVAIKSEPSITLRTVIASGEQLQITPAIMTLFDRMPHCNLYNHYGPTETHVVTTYLLSGKSASWPKLPPIGLPIPNTQVYVLDEQLNPVDVGQPGELYIRGVCLAQGYINQPELTREKFISHLLGKGTLYKTGDLAKLHSDGNIEFLGRIDKQVKVRGFRVDLGEIEVVLAQHPEVQECVVEAREDISNLKRLVAYIVPRAGLQQLTAPLLECTIRQREPKWYNYLETYFPEYMIPSTFVLLPKLPLTPSGKIDRTSLPSPLASRPSLDVPLVQPQTNLETKILLVWQELLQLENIGIYDNFFDLGGHSLLLIHLHIKLSETLKNDFPIVALFQNPTIASFARYIDQDKANFYSEEKYSQRLNQVGTMRARGNRRREIISRSQSENE